MRNILFFSMVFLCWTSCSSQQEKWSATVEGYFFVLGDLGATHEAGLGATFRYHFKSEKVLKPGIGLRYIRSIDSQGSVLNASGVFGELVYNLGRRPKKGFYLGLEAGPLVLNEHFSVQLAKGIKTKSSSSLGFMTGFDLGYRFSKNLGVTLGFQQINTLATALKTGLVLKF